MAAKDSKLGVVGDPIMTPALCRQARDLLGWTRGDLASRAFISSATVKNLEESKTKPSQPILSAIRSAVEAAGVIIEGSPEGEPQATLKTVEDPFTPAVVDTAGYAVPG